MQDEGGGSPEKRTGAYKGEGVVVMYRTYAIDFFCYFYFCHACLEETNSHKVKLTFTDEIFNFVGENSSP